MEDFNAAELGGIASGLRSVKVSMMTMYFSKLFGAVLYQLISVPNTIA